MLKKRKVEIQPLLCEVGGIFEGERNLTPAQRKKMYKLNMVNSI